MKYIHFIEKCSAVLFSACLLMGGCSKQPPATSGIPLAPDKTESSAPMTTDSINSHNPSTINSTQKSKEHIKNSPAKEAAYNAAIKVYNEFLNGKINAKEKNTDKTFSINKMTNINGNPGIDRFALFDLNGDRIPELHTRSCFYDVFSYKDEKLVHWYTSINLMDGSVFALDNGAIFSVHDTTGTEYNYTTFGPDGAATAISFFDPSSFASQDPENAIYSFNDKDVSKKEFDNLTKDYIALSKKPASIEWIAYEL